VSVLSAELAAISGAPDYALHHITQKRLVLVTDSQHALNAIAQGYSISSKQVVIAHIIKHIPNLDIRDVHNNFGWIPAHAGVEGNEKADKAAKVMANQTEAPTRPKEERQREVEGVIALIIKDIDDKRPKRSDRKMPGQHTWRIDQALPGKHTLRLYGLMTSDQTAILIQARTGHCQLDRWTDPSFARD
jgi:hypothetical protein